MLCLACGRSVARPARGAELPLIASGATPAAQVGHSSATEPAAVPAEPPGSPPPGFTVPQSPTPGTPTVRLPLPPPLVPVVTRPEARFEVGPGVRSDVQDSVPQDAPYAALPAVPVESPRWSGKRTAAVAAIALALTSAGAIAAAAASPNGLAAPSEQRSGQRFGPGGPNHQFGPGGGAPGRQQAPGQQGFGSGQGRPGR